MQLVRGTEEINIRIHELNEWINGRINAEIIQHKRFQVASQQMD